MGKSIKNQVEVHESFWSEVSWEKFSRKLAENLCYLSRKTGSRKKALVQVCWGLYRSWKYSTLHTQQAKIARKLRCSLTDEPPHLQCSFCPEASRKMTIMHRNASLSFKHGTLFSASFAYFHTIRPLKNICRWCSERLCDEWFCYF